MQNLIEVEKLTFSFNAQEPILKSIDLSIAAGEYIALIGPNGSGKTSLVRHFNALLLPSEGSVKIDGLDTRNQKKQMEIRRRVGMIFQNPDNQIVGMNVEEDVAFGPGNLRLPSPEIRRRVDHALEMVGLSGLEMRSPYQLSGGQKQLLAMAGLLAMNPEIIILDEPTASLDPDSKKKVLDLLHDLHTRGIGIIHVTQSMDEAALAHRILVMDQGRLVADGSPSEILSRVDWLKELGLAPPQITEFMWLLQKTGITVNHKIFSLEAAVEEIESLVSKQRDGVFVSPLKRL